MMLSSFRWRANCEIQITRYVSAALSVPALRAQEPFREKDLLASADESSGVESHVGKATLAEHLDFIERSGLIRQDAPLMVIGLRNNLVNLRAPVIIEDRPYSVESERPLESARAYFGLGSRDGRLLVGRALGESRERWPEFFVAGIPVLWDDVDDGTLLEMMITEASDHSHVFYLPRGAHPQATDATRAAWTRLHDVFAANIHADRRRAASAIRAVVEASDPPLRRCRNYFHSAIGVTDAGALVCVYMHGRLETLGRRARALGCRRAICVENSGSIMPTYLPNGLRGEQIPLLRAPNFRPLARVVLVLALETAGFEPLVVTEEELESFH